MAEPTMMTCPTCHAPLPEGVAGGMCPACLLRRGLETRTVGFTEEGAPASSSPSRWEPPRSEELASQFPALEFIELLGRGGMGAVYKVRQREIDRLAALKILPPHFASDPAFAGRFAREAKALAKLNHPNVVTLYEFGRTDPGLYFFLMEYVDGPNLRGLMGAGRVEPREALAIVPQVCDALQYAHDSGVVHRDIKPENILLDRRGRVKVADFGLAKIAGQDDAPPASNAGSVHVAVTEAGRVLGTPNYMAPEQVERPNAVDHRADIYALGVVFYQMLTGELPAGRIEPPSTKISVDVRLDEVVLRALEREPARRYGQASVMKADVETVAGGAGAAAAVVAAPAGGGGYAPPSRAPLNYVPLTYLVATSLGTLAWMSASGWRSAGPLVAGCAAMLPALAWGIGRGRRGYVVAALVLLVGFGAGAGVMAGVVIPRRQAAATAKAGGAVTRGVTQSTAAAPVPSGPFGPVLERVLPDPDNGNIASNEETLRLRTGQMMNVLKGGPRGGGARLDALLASEADLFAEHGDYLAGQWALITAGLKLADFPTAQWETATAADVAEALKGSTSMQHVTQSGAVMYVPPETFVPLTLAFEAWDGSRGLLQITGFVDEPRGVKVRYKVLEEAPPTARPAARDAGTLGPATERVLYSVTAQRPVKGLDLDGDREVEVREEQTRGGEGRFFRWAAEHGVDLMAYGHKHRWALWTSLRLASVDAAAWERAAAADVDAALKAESPGLALADQSRMPGSSSYDITGIEFPRTFAFRTPAGNRGLLQLTGLAEAPPAVKVRYRMVQDGAAAPSAAHE